MDSSKTGPASIDVDILDTDGAGGKINQTFNFKNAIQYFNAVVKIFRVNVYFSTGCRPFLEALNSTAAFSEENKKKRKNCTFLIQTVLYRN